MAIEFSSLPHERIADLCRANQILTLEVFGSALRDDCRSESDIDILVTLGSDADWSLLDHVRIEMELSELLGRSVDLVSRRAVERSADAARRREILESARVLYGAA